MKKVNGYLVRTVATLIGGTEGLTAEFREDEDRWVLAWEEGPEEWTLNLPGAVRRYAESRGLLLEPINHCMLGVYWA